MGIQLSGILDDTFTQPLNQHALFLPELLGIHSSGIDILLARFTLIRSK